jgi:hypothetical protein
MVFDDSNIYSLFAHNVGNNINPRTHYSLYAWRKDAAVAAEAESIGATAAREKAAAKRKGKQKPHQQPAAKQSQSVWALDNPGVHANAMVLTGDKLFLAGAPDVADETQTREYVFGADDGVAAQMRRQEKAWLGAEGGVLAVVSAETGDKLAEYKTDSIPVWDGLIAAGEKLYAAMQDGTVVCYSQK